MRAVDPRLLRQAGSARGYLAVTIALGLAGAVLILLQADLLARALAGAARGTGIAAATRRALMRDLLAATAGRTMLLITHDLDGLDELDQVIVLDRGKIAGFHPARTARPGRRTARPAARAGQPLVRRGGRQRRFPAR